MNVAIGSIFRDSATYVDRYVAQVEALRAAAPQHTFRCILAEGDSADDTYDRLKSHFNGSVFKREHGGPKFGSVDNAQRHRQLSWVYEAVLERLKPEDDVFVYVESDLIWTPQCLLGLIGRLDTAGVDMVAPNVMTTGRWYDSWAFHGMDGKNFGFWFPYHPELLGPGKNGLYPLSGAGSCIVMKAVVARQAHFTPPDYCILGFCWDALNKGFKLWLDSGQTVNHP